MEIHNKYNVQINKYKVINSKLDDIEDVLAIELLNNKKKYDALFNNYNESLKLFEQINTQNQMQNQYPNKIHIQSPLLPPLHHQGLSHKYTN